MARSLVGVARGSVSPLVMMVPGRPSTAAALTGVPLRIACIIGLTLSRELGVGMRERRGADGRNSREVGAIKLPGTPADIRDGVGGSEDIHWNSAPFLVTETTLPEPNSTKRPFSWSYSTPWSLSVEETCSAAAE